MMKNIHITTKITLVLIVFVGVFMIALSIPAYLENKSAARSAVISELSSTSLEKQSAFEAWINNRLRSIESISNHEYLRGLVSSFIDSPEQSSIWKTNYPAIESILDDWTGNNHNFVSLEILDARNGEILISTNFADRGKFRENQAYFIEGKIFPYAQNPIYDLTLQKPVMKVSVPMYSLDGDLIAVLAGQLNMDELNEIILRRTGLHQSDDVYLVNPSHLLVTQPRLIGDPAVLKRGIFSTAVNDCLKQQSGELDTPDYRGVPAIIVYRWLPIQKLCLITKLDQTEAYARNQTRTSNMVITGLFCLLLGSIGAVYLSRTITKPIHILSEGTAQITSGNLDFRIEITSRDELGKLGEAFNQMAGSLAESKSLLTNWGNEQEERVQERTRELTTANDYIENLIEYCECDDHWAGCYWPGNCI